MPENDRSNLTFFPHESIGKFPVCLFEPEIPLNVGSIARTCACTGNPLHLIGRLGFHLDNSRAKRAGLDYWEHVDVSVHRTWDEFSNAIDTPRGWFFSTGGVTQYWDVKYLPGDFLLFGSETNGLPRGILEENAARVVRIPMVDGIRSLNLSNCVAIALYEAIRQNSRGLKKSNFP